MDAFVMGLMALGIIIFVGLLADEWWNDRGL